MASSTNGLYGSIPFGSTPQEAVTMTLGYKHKDNGRNSSNFLNFNLIFFLLLKSVYWNQQLH